MNANTATARAHIAGRRFDFEFLVLRASLMIHGASSVANDGACASTRSAPPFHTASMLGATRPGKKSYSMIETIGEDDSSARRIRSEFVFVDASIATPADEHRVGEQQQA
jgi:hypothetical protein